MDVTDPGAAVWDQRPGENADSFALFLAWAVKEPGHTLKDFATEQGLGASTIYNLSSRHRWPARVTALRLHRTTARERAQSVLWESQAKKQAEAWAMTMDLAMEALARIYADGDKLSPRDALALLREATTAQRLAAGEVTERSALDLSGASTEDLEAWAAAHDKLKG